MLAHHRDEARVEIGTTVFPALVVTLDADPRHLATAQKVRAEAGAIGKKFSNLPVGANSRDVVLGVAGAHAGRASGAAREIDRHRPAALGHSAPVIRIVHPLVFRAWIALFALSIIRHRRPKTGKEFVRRISGHLLA